MKNVSVDGKIRYTYTEHSSKNRAGGFRQLYVPPKVVQQYKDVDAGEICHVAVLDKYLNLLPEKAKKEDVFYLRPLDKHPKEGPVWFSSTPLGKNTLDNMVKNTCKEVGIFGNKTNHFGLRA